LLQCFSAVSRQFDGLGQEAPDADVVVQHVACFGPRVINDLGCAFYQVAPDRRQNVFQLVAV
jgi:hypothetical protein